MKILFVTPRFHTNLYQLVKTFKENNHEVFLHVSSLGFTEDYSLVKPVRYSQCKASLFIEKILGKGGVNRPNYFPGPVAYWQAFRKLRPDIVIIRDPYKFFSLLAAVCARFAKAKIVFYTQENLLGPKSNKNRLKRRLTLNVFNAAWMTPIINEARGEKDRIRYMYFVPLPIPIKQPSLSKKYESGITKVLMIGKYHQGRKNHMLFIKAIAELSCKYQFKVTIVGECRRDQQVEKYNLLKNTIHHLGLAGIVDLKKNIPYKQMEDLYLAHHLFVLPARDEQYGVSVTEALGYGLPAICTDTCGARFNIINGKNGFVIKSDSMEELTKALEFFLSDREQLRSMSENSLQYVRENLSGSAFYAKFTHLMKDRFQLQPFD